MIDQPTPQNPDQAAEQPPPDGDAATTEHESQPTVIAGSPAGSEAATIAEAVPSEPATEVATPGPAAEAVPSEPATEVVTPAPAAAAASPGPVAPPIPPKRSAPEPFPVGPPPPPLSLDSGGAAAGSERPEIPVAAAFAGGFVLALILKRLAR